MLPDLPQRPLLISLSTDECHLACPRRCLHLMWNSRTAVAGAKQTGLFMGFMAVFAT